MENDKSKEQRIDEIVATVKGKMKDKGIMTESVEKHIDEIAQNIKEKVK